MAEHSNKHFRAVHGRNMYKKKPHAKEVKIWNTEPNKLENTDVETLILNVALAANAFKSALKNLKIDDFHNNVKKKEIIKVLADMQNMIKLKILALKKDEGKKTEEESSRARIAQGNPFLSSLSELSSKKSLPPVEWTKKNRPDAESEAFSTSKLMSLSKLSLSSERSSQNNASIHGSDKVEHDDDDDDDIYYDEYDDEDNEEDVYDIVDDDDVDEDDDNYDGVEGYDEEKFREFFASVNCPFCLRREDNKNSLAKHLDTTCTTFKNGTFVKSFKCPYSVFQILPNNAFKCNVCGCIVRGKIKKYFAHSRSSAHTELFKRAALIKNYSDLLFCSTCKISVPNNATQILFHLKHEDHERSRRCQRSTFYYRRNGIQFIYNRDKKFKCLTCSAVKGIHKSVKDILQHLESNPHSSSFQSQRTPTMYCMFCLDKVNGFNIVGHLNSTTHIQKEKEAENSKFELCFYCDFQCSTLHLLAVHLKGCPALDLIRQEINHQKCEKVDRVPTQVEKDQERPTKEDTSEEGRCIVVKDYHKILELYNYFKRFGEVLEIERSGENGIVIKFQDEKTVDAILKSQRPIEINGVKLKITRKEGLESSDKVLERSRTAESTDYRPARSNGGSDDNFANSTVQAFLRSMNSTVKEDFSKATKVATVKEDFSNATKVATVKDFSKVTVDDGPLESLFSRVSSHLSYNSLKPDCEDVLNIALDCERILKLGKCHATGFLKCGLSFPVEEITFYLELSDGLVISDVSRSSLTESVVFNKSMCQECVKLLNQATEIRSKLHVIEYPFPLIKFFDHKTQKHCSITFRQSDNILADELRYCLKDNSNLRSFVLIIRFWLSVHQLEIRNFDSVIISLLLFFLLRSGIVKNFSENLRLTPAHEQLYRYVAQWEQDCVGNNQNIGKLTTRPNVENSVMELFQKFLLFLNQLDLEGTAICLPVPYPVPKIKVFQERLKKYLSQKGDPEPPVVIMDPFLLNNLAEGIGEADRESLMKTVRETIEHYHIR